MKRKNFEFPTAFTVLFIILIAVTILTHVIPAGNYSRLIYSSETNEFFVNAENKETKILEAKQENLEELGINIDIEKFTSGVIKKPMAIPNTYEKLENQSKGFVDLIRAPIAGIADSIDIIIFIIVLGGTVGVINKTGTFNTAMKAISLRTKGKEFLLIVIAFIFVALGGTTFGFLEETIPFYSILVPLFLASGFDVLTCMATIFLASAVGCMFSTVNPFSTIIASNAAGISFNEGLKFRLVAFVIGSIISLAYIYYYARKVKRDPKTSLVYEFREESRERFLKSYGYDEEINFSFKQKIIIFLFIIQFVIMIWGVSSLDWWFQEIAAMFFGVSLLIMFLSGLSEKDAVNSFISGASEVIGVALIIGLARAINIIMETGMISDTLLYYSTNLVLGMNKGLFSIVLVLIYTFLGIFIPSTSGLAVLSMPILAPLATTLGVSRTVVIDAFAWGQGLVLFVTPTGLIFVVLQIVGIPYNKWLKFVLPLMFMMSIFVFMMIYLKTII